MDHRRARALRKDMTDAELYLWNKLQRRQVSGVKFRRQSPIGCYIVDFVCFERKLVVELDGPRHAEQVDYDEKRTKWLHGQGFRVMRFWNEEVLQRVEDVVGKIEDSLKEIPPTPALPHKGGGSSSSRGRESRAQAMGGSPKREGEAGRSEVTSTKRTTGPANSTR